MLRPVDMQDNYSKAPLAGRQQHIQQASPEIAQRQAAAQQARQHQLDQTRALPADARDEVQLRAEDQGQREERRRRRRQPAAEQEDHDPPAPGPAGPSHIDLTA